MVRQAQGADVHMDSSSQGLDLWEYGPTMTGHLILQGISRLEIFGVKP